MLDELAADAGMQADEALFLERQRRRLPQHGFGHRQLPEIVQQRGALERREVGRAETERAPHGCRKIRDAIRMRVRVGRGRHQRRQQDIEIVVAVDEVRRDNFLEMRAPGEHLVLEALAPPS